MVRNGEVTTHAGIDYANTDNYFINIYDDVNNINPGEGYVFSTFTIAGKEEYEHLTGDNESFELAYYPSGGRKAWERPVAYTDLNGAIRVYDYVVDNYFRADDTTTDLLSVIYLSNIDSGDPVTQGFIEWFNSNALYSSVSGTLTNGWNVFRLKAGAAPGTNEKLY
jgi:hypothetical protein